MKSLIREKLILSAHDCADGGLFIALLESAMPNGIGFSISTKADLRKDAFLFGEAQSRVVVSVSKTEETRFTEAMKKSGTAFELLGETGGKNMLVDGEDFGAVTAYKNSYDTALELLLQ